MNTIVVAFVLGILFGAEGSLSRWIAGAMCVVATVVMGITLGNGLNVLSALQAAIAILGYNFGLVAAILGRVGFKPYPS